jgi:DNA-binding MarR family transcriptional regulator
MSRLFHKACPRRPPRVIVRLTRKGRTAVDGAFEALLAAEAELLADLPVRDQKKLASLLRTLLVPYS